MRQRAARFGWRGWMGRAGVAVALMLAVWLSAARPAPAQDGPTPLVAVLLVDGSESMTRTDPGQFRETAAIFLVDFLRANSDTFNRHYRLGAAAFDERIIVDFGPKRVSEVDMTDIRVDTPDPLRGTDFKVALEHAIIELTPYEGSVEQLAVVLFTDGNPIQNGAPVGDLDAYFSELGGQIATLRDMGVQVFVAGIGDAVEDRARWEAILDEVNFQSIDDPNELYGVYSNWFGELIGLEAVGDAERLEAGRDESFELDPFLEQVVVTAIKDDPAVEFTLFRPDGTVEPLPPERAGERHAVYTVPSPAGGDWSVEVNGGGADYYVWQRRASATLLADRERPTLDGQLLIQMIDLSDRLAAAGEDLYVFLEVSDARGDVVDRAEMAREENVAAFTRPFISLSENLKVAGEYTFDVAAKVGDVSVDLDVAPLALTVYELPEIAAVRIDREPQLHEGQPLEVEAGDSLLVEVEVTHPELLGEAARLTYDLATTEESEFNAAAEPTADGHRLYTAFVAVPEDALGGPLVIRLGGESTIGALLNDDWMVGLGALAVMPGPVGPVVEATETPTVTPTPAPEPPLPEPSQAVNPWLVLVVAIALTGTIATYLFLKYGESIRWLLWDRRRIVNRTIEQLKEARLYANREKNLDVTVAFFTSEDKFHSKQVNTLRKDSFTVLKEFARFHLENGKKNWGGFYEDLGRFFKRLGDTLEFHLPDIAGMLFADDIWGTEEPYFAVESLYVLIKKGLPVAELVEALAQKDPNEKRRELFEALAGAIKYPSSASLSEVRKESNELEGQAKEGFASVYSLLADFYRSPAFATNSAEFGRIIPALREHGPAILHDLFSEIRSLLPTDSHPVTEEEWKNIFDKLSAIEKKTEEYKFKDFPEALFIRHRISEWKQIAEQEKQLFIKSKSRSIETGKLVAEIRPSLDLYENEEGKKDGKWGEWGTINVPALVYHVGETRISNAQIRSKIFEPGQKEEEGPGPSQGVRLESGEYVRVVLDVNKLVTQQSEIELWSSYKTKILTPGGESREDTEGNLIEKRIIVHTLQNRRKLSEVKVSPYVPDEPLASESPAEDSVSGPLNEDSPAKGSPRAYLVPDLADDMVRHLMQSEPGIQLISLRGLRRTGKTTTLLAFCKKLLNQEAIDEAQNRHYLPVTLDLKKWFNRIGRGTGERDLEIPFWLEVFRLIAEEINPLESASQVRESFLEWEDSIRQGKDEFKSIRKHLYARINQLTEITGKQLILIIDEADLFTYFGSASIYDELADLGKQAKVPLVISYDSYERSWSNELKKSFGDKVNNEGSSSPQRPTSSYFKEFSTTMLGYSQMLDLLGRGDLEFTDLAKKAAWVFTGGYISLVQLLCHHLIVTRRDKATIPKESLQSDQHDRVEAKGQELSTAVAGNLDDSQAVQNHEPLVDVTVTTDDVKSVVLDFSTKFTSILEYLGHSFSPEEYLLMMVVASDHLDPETGILLRIRYRPEPGNRHQWDDFDVLMRDIEEQYPGKLDPDMFAPLLTGLLKKQILEQVVVEEQPLQYVRWRVGWLVRYLRDSTYYDLAPLLKAIAPARQRVGD